MQSYWGFPQHWDWLLSFLGQIWLHLCLSQLTKTKETEQDVWMCFIENPQSFVFCFFTEQSAIPLSHSVFWPLIGLLCLYFFIWDLRPASFKQMFNIKYLVSHLIFTALMDVRWSFGRELQLFPTGGPSCLGPLTGIRSSCREDRGRSQPKCDWMSSNKRVLAMLFQG